MDDIPQDNLKKLLSHPLLSTICFRNVLLELPLEIMEVINVDSFFLSLLGHYGKAKFQEDIKPSSYRRHKNGIWSGKIIESKLLTKINTYKKLNIFYKKQNQIELVAFFEKSSKNHTKMLFIHYIKTFQFLKAIQLLSYRIF